MTERPERTMVRRALLAGAGAVPLAYGVAALLDGGDAGISAALGVVVVAANFAAHGLSLAWAAGVSVTAVQAVALAGFAVRMGILLGAMVLLARTSFFVPAAFGISVVLSTLALLSYEARLVLSMRSLDIPPEPAAARAHEALRAKEAAAR